MSNLNIVITHIFTNLCRNWNGFYCLKFRNFESFLDSAKSLRQLKKDSLILMKLLF